MKRLIAFVLLLAAFCTAAMAEERLSWNGEGSDQLVYDCTLPDGRLLFTGSQGKKGDYTQRKARILCLNPDWSVSWEYMEDTKGGCSFGGARLLPDGRIGVLFSNTTRNQENVQEEIRYFTQDGKPAGDPVDIFHPDLLMTNMTPSCIAYAIIPEDAQTYYHCFMDWEGNMLFRWRSDERMGGGFVLEEVEDGLVFAGYEPTYPSHAKLMKTDWYGNLIWETVVPTLLPDGDARLEKMTKLSDGGFAAYLTEHVFHSSTDSYDFARAIARFDQSGRLLWVDQEHVQTSGNDTCCDLIEYQGRIVVAMKENGNFESTKKRMNLWFDLDGNYLGETEQKIQPGELNIYRRFVIKENELWALMDIQKGTKFDTNKTDEYLVRVPEL